MTIRRFEDLSVYQLAYEMSLEIHRRSFYFPTFEQKELGRQIRGCSKSVCANIAEGFGKQNFSPIEFKRYLKIAIGSSDETKVWIHFCKDLGYIEQGTHDVWYDKYTDIAKMLSGLCKNWK